MKETLKTIIRVLEDKKALDVRVIDVKTVCSFTDHFVICSAANERHMQTLSEEVAVQLKKELNVTPSHIEGEKDAEWILLDYFDLVVHIFSLEAREFYELKRLWADGVELTPAGSQ